MAKKESDEDGFRKSDPRVSNRVSVGFVRVLNVAADYMDPTVTANNVAAIAEPESAGDETVTAKCVVLQHSLADAGDLLSAGHGNAGYGVAVANEASKAVSGGFSSDLQGWTEPSSYLLRSDDGVRSKKSIPVLGGGDLPPFRSMLGAIRTVSSMNRRGSRAVVPLRVATVKSDYEDAVDVASNKGAAGLSKVQGMALMKQRPFRYDKGVRMTSFFLDLGGVDFPPIPLGGETKYNLSGLGLRSGLNWVVTNVSYRNSGDPVVGKPAGEPGSSLLMGDRGLSAISPPNWRSLFAEQPN